MGRLLALAAALIAAALIAWADARTPAPAPAAAAAADFSAERAMADIGAIASVPHPIGSPADRAARDVLVQRMAAMGLDPQVRRGAGVEVSRFDPTRAAGGFVDNIVGVLPGKDRSLPALALMAHYDSVPASPGSADDAAGVAAVLETVRAIQARGVPARDVMVLLTDGEEAGLLGANAFFASDPSAKRIGFLINLEARGSAGRAQMFQTGQDNGQTVALLQRTAVRPQASSLTGFVYQHMPNDTDFTVSRKAGVAGMNYAFIGHQFDYHSPSSTPATTDRGTLQDLGQQVLASAAAVAFSPVLPARAPDVVFGQTPGGLTLAYPPAVGWLVLAVSAALLAWGVMRARRVEAFPWLDLARGAGAALFAVLSAVVLMHFTRRATGAAFGFLAQRFLLAQAPRWEAALVLTGLGMLLLAIAEAARGRRRVILLPLLAALLSCLAGGLDVLALEIAAAAAVVGALAYGRPVSRAGAWAGAMVLLLVLGAVAQALAPPAAFVLAWPLTLGALGAAATALAARRGPASLIVLGILGAVGLAFAAGFAHSSYLSLDLPELLALPLLIALPVIWPLAQPDEGAPPARLVGPILLVAGLALTAAVRLNHPYDARHPLATDVVYQIDQDARSAWRVSVTPGLDPWSAGVLKTGGASLTKFSNWRFTRPMDAASAPYLDLPGPQMSLARGADGDLVLHVVPPPGARTIGLRLTSNTVATVTSVGGAAVHLAIPPGKSAGVNWSAAPDGFDLILRPAGPGRLTVAYAATVEQWPAAAPPLPRRPADVMAFDTSDSTVLTGTRSFSW
ncbi:M20/M25/M40 family metallo-hydrolase [Phenylobacterium sp.]|uniref:M20/M25/M40 family metallo-hydrolase n=1 Tax=Phenylobacterium sp. TaxID=1871053 RepID=UPI001204DC5B|nr:M20/M25/M40 family metallo-hydrolase [Phenylobacterium sp.]THD62172.1 MAG: M20/M25/M40 family metallo-hydrolase [Phenylobacterium sp.]